VVVVHDFHLLGRGNRGEVLEARDETRPFLFRKSRLKRFTKAERGVPRAVDATRALGDNRDPRPQRFQKRQMVPKCFLLRGEVA
jgi:hypothetical protein